MAIPTLHVAADAARHDRCLPSSIPPRKDEKCGWSKAFAEELVDIRTRNIGDEDRLIGLAFSGGGIRSATFNLGVLQALRKLDLLSKVHYLSTVSGGGYIGAWLSANCHRAELRGENWLREGGADWTPAITHLRRYSNYLSPRVGFFSADTWSMFMVWIRNALLVQATIILLIAVVLLVPRLTFDGFLHWPGVGQWRWITVSLFVLAVVGTAGNQLSLNRPDIWLLKSENWTLSVGGSLFLIGALLGFMWLFHFNPFANGPTSYVKAVPIAALTVLAGFVLQPAAVKFAAAVLRLLGDADPPQRVDYTQAWTQWLVVVPIMLTAYLVAAVLYRLSGSAAFAGVDSYGQIFKRSAQYWDFSLAVMFVSLWLLSACSIRDWTTWRGALIASVLTPILPVLVFHALLSAIMLALRSWLTAAADAMVWAPPLVLYAFSLTVVVLMGMLSRDAAEGSREWWSRLGAWLGIYGFCWMVIAVTAVYGPGWLDALTSHTWKQVATAGGWVATTAAGLLAGRSGDTSGDPEKKTKWVAEIVARVAPFVFIAGLLIAVAAVLDYLVAVNSGLGWRDFTSSHTHLLAVSGSSPSWDFLSYSLIFLAGCTSLLAVMAFRIDINEFSLNAFYRNRLTRCYLGATRPASDRKPQNFTGFDEDDDLQMSTLCSGPLHVVNCALNLGGSSDLALHTRHSATFTITPLRCGSNYEVKQQTGELKKHTKKAQKHPAAADQAVEPEKQTDRAKESTSRAISEIGYLPTAMYGGSNAKVTLGQAISVSGAAASPNMGYHTSPVVAFLLTLFNVRLGWWFSNPYIADANTTAPRFNLRYLLAELFGGANDQSKFLMISDGGHFENLAAYELMKRRCKVIIVCDAECDPGLKFEGLGTLVRMCEVDDLGKITIDTSAIRPAAGSRWSANRCAVGTIEYPDHTTGTLIYLKASMNGHEASDVLQYKDSHSAFPHESTGDQFYGEDQFESYRKLGLDVAYHALEPASNEPGFVELAQKLARLALPTAGNPDHFTENTTRLMKVWDELASRPELEVLHRELVGQEWPADWPATYREAFYQCCKMIQLMENVYLDLSLDSTWEHPDNVGWRALFANWASSRIFQETWRIARGMYGVRFRYFCERQLGLPLRDPAVVVAPVDAIPPQPERT